jgi:hypothetical protein
VQLGENTVCKSQLSSKYNHQSIAKTIKMNNYKILNYYIFKGEAFNRRELGIEFVFDAKVDVDA